MAAKLQLLAPLMPKQFCYHGYSPLVMCTTVLVNQSPIEEAAVVKVIQRMLIGVNER